MGFPVEAFLRYGFIYLSVSESSKFIRLPASVHPE